MTLAPTTAPKIGGFLFVSSRSRLVATRLQQEAREADRTLSAQIRRLVRAHLDDEPREREAAS